MKITEHKAEQIFRIALQYAYEAADEHFTGMYGIVENLPRKEYYSEFLYRLAENELISVPTMGIMLKFADPDMKYQNKNHSY